MRRRKLIFGVAAFLSSCRSRIKDFGLDSGSKEEDTSSLEEGSDIICEEQELSISLLEYPELKEVGGAAYLSFSEQFVHLLVMCISEEKWAAVWKICTHGVCDVEWDPSLSLVVCPCHGSLFDIDGVVLQGPAEKDLKAFSVCRVDELLFLSPQAD